jgi:RND family efflux transporter MFP subunit
VVFRFQHRNAWFLTALFVACHHEAQEAPPDLPHVTTMTVTRQTREAKIAITGVLSPLPGRDVKVGALEAGRVDRVYVAEGDFVRVGAVLAHVEAQPLKDRIAETGAQRVEASAVLDNAQTKLARAEHLWKDGIVARQEVDDAKTALVAAQSGVAQATAVNGTAAVHLDRATLRAPIDGVVAAVIVPAGQPVDGNGTPVIEIADTKVLDLRAAVPAALAGSITLGMKAEVFSDQQTKVEATVQAIAPLVDSATNTLMVRVRIANADGKLRGGAYGKGALIGRPHAGFFIPLSAFMPGEGGSASTLAIVDPDGTLHQVAAQLGVETGDEVEVLTGLSEGQRVVIAGGYSIPDGTKVVTQP